MLIDNINQIRYRMRAASLRSGREADAVSLVAVTKYAPLESVRALLEQGLAAEVGENRVQDAERKKAELGALAGRARWRLIGHLQTNKAKKAVGVFDAVDSVDSERVAAALDAALAGTDRVLPVLVQVKLTGKETQAGVAPDELPGLLEALKKYPRLRAEGLMGIAPEVEPLEAVRPSFRLLRGLRDRCLPGGKLSMGMSRDFEVAIEEGADLVRIGSQIFTQPSPASRGGTA
ncbi:MAG: YggS family pyridoxal phosphate-dependent enzyme [Elusimicrobiota bacterium]|nr:YggS family pyridoxal phosphate-dependent enzyme [Elusimicrobiota bacterium]